MRIRKRLKLTVMFPGRKTLVIAVNVITKCFFEDRALVEESPFQEDIFLGKDLLLENYNCRVVVALKRSLDEDLFSRAVDVQDLRHLEHREIHRLVVDAVVILVAVLHVQFILLFAFEVGIVGNVICHICKTMEKCNTTNNNRRTLDSRASL